MDWNWKEHNQVKTLFKTIYCWDCKQVKICGKLSSEYCCLCSFQDQQDRTQEYSTYEKTLAKKQRERQKHIQQLQLLRSHQGCRDCTSLEVDAYSLYEENKLVCQN